MSRKLLCEAPGLDWTIVRPTGLTDKQPARTWRSYEVGSGAKLGGPIPRRDLAACLLNALLTLRCRGQGVWSKQLRRQIDLEPGQTGRTPRTSARRRRHPCAVTGFAGVAAVACPRLGRRDTRAAEPQHDTCQDPDTQGQGCSASPGAVDVPC